ncbi:MAG: hypothetical protein HY300_09765 [Verrucomicrobia bacterium]|nr:hypothetical protein [Verrucomicrobiota bacterium]
MTFLPIVERELRVAARNPSLYKTRAGAAFLAIAFGVWAMISYNTLRFAGVGMGTPSALFGQFAWFLFIFCLLSGPHHAADCLSSEKREGTLGLLFLTHLTGLDIVLGKLAASATASFYRLLSVFPVVAVLLTLGGVTAGEFFRVSLVLVNTLLLSNAVAIFASALGTDARRTKGSAVSILLFLWLVLPGCEALLGLKWPHPWLQAALLMKWRERWAQFCYGNAEKRLAWRRKLLAQNPFFWLLARNRLLPYWIWFVFAVIFALFSFFFALAFVKGAGEAAPAIAIWGALVLHLVLKLRFLGDASTPFAVGRRNGSLEWLLSMPLSVADIIRGQWLALRWVHLGLTVSVLLADALMLVTGVVGITTSQGGWDEDATGFVLAMLAGMGMLVADLITLGWTGMWTGLSARELRQASGQAFTHVLLLPWIVYGLFAAATGTAMNYSWMPEPGPLYWIGSWFVIGIVNDCFWFWWSRRKLYLEFRRLASPVTIEPQPKWWHIFWKPRATETPGVLAG